MISVDQVHSIERLRAAAKEHGEVADLLAVLTEAFPFLEEGDFSFHGDEEHEVHLKMAVTAASFVAFDSCKAQE